MRSSRSSMRSSRRPAILNAEREEAWSDRNPVWVSSMQFNGRFRLADETARALPRKPPGALLADENRHSHWLTHTPPPRRRNAATPQQVSAYSTCTRFIIYLLW